MDSSIIIDYTLSDTNLHIINSYKIRCRKVMREQIDLIRNSNPDLTLFRERKTPDMVREWRAHNLCYDLRILRDRTADADLQVPRKWYEAIVYFILSIFYIG